MIFDWKLMISNENLWFFMEIIILFMKNHVLSWFLNNIICYGNLQFVIVKANYHDPSRICFYDPRRNRKTSICFCFCLSAPGLKTSDSSSSFLQLALKLIQIEWLWPIFVSSPPKFTTFLFGGWIGTDNKLHAALWWKDMIFHEKSFLIKNNDWSKQKHEESLLI